jgi:hypothetical protein
VLAVTRTSRGYQRLLLECVPWLSADARVRIVAHWLNMEDGSANAAISRADRETLIAYGFAAAVVREYFLATKERDEATREGREPRW